MNLLTALSGLNVEVRTVPHSQQRYNTVGDYQTVDGKTTILVSDMGDRRSESLVAYHELTEILLCLNSGVTDKQIDGFDFAWDSKRDSSDTSEPGDDPASPYYHQHQFAMASEKGMAAQLGVDWDEHEERIAQTMLSYPR